MYLSVSRYFNNNDPYLIKYVISTSFSKNTSHANSQTLGTTYSSRMR